MGAAHSSEPRSVSMDNPNPGIIDLSDEVVGRLKKGISKQAKANQIEEASAPTPPQPKKEQARVVPVKAAPPPPTIVYQNPTPSAIFIPANGPTMTAADVRRQKEIELQQNDDLWRQRMRDLEVTLNKTNAVMEKEYSTATEDVRKRFANAAPAHQLPPCQDLKAQVIACYRANPGETLKCSEAVAMFRNCVSMHRVQKLDAEEKAATTATKTPVSAEAVKAG